MSKFILIIVIGGFISYGIISINLNTKITAGTENSVKTFSTRQSRNIANSMAQMILSGINDSTSWRVATPVDKNIFDGVATYSFIDTVVAGDTLIKISVTGKYNDYETNVTVYAEKPAAGFVPNVVRGAWTANGPLDKTISDMFIDGRDYDAFGVIIPGEGVHGVSTSVPFINTANAAIGGTHLSVDYPMEYPENPLVIEENYNWGGQFPTTPDAALGIPEGTLKSIAQSGQDGSQYVTDPDDLTLPLSGVTYIELPDDHEEKIDLKSILSKGILVIHNSSGSTRIKQTKVKKNLNLFFEGLIIGDYMFHFHLDVHGSIILLSPDLETSKTCKGNKNHKILYSSLSIKNATSILGISSSEGSQNYGFGKHRLVVRHWLE